MTDIKATTSSRRNMIKGGIAAAGVAYVAPAVLNSSVAGALTTTCFNIKYDGNCNTATDASAGDSGCLGFVPTGGTNGGAAAGHAMVEVLSGSCGGTSQTVLKVTCPVGTTIGSVRATIKSSGNPTTGCHAVPGIVINGNVATIDFDNSPNGQNAISHITFGFCCTTSS